MSESALEEAAVLSAIYCGEGEYQLIQVSGRKFQLLDQIYTPLRTDINQLRTPLK